MACREVAGELFEGVTTIGASVLLELALNEEVRRRELRQACPLAAEGGLSALHGSLCFGERQGKRQAAAPCFDERCASVSARRRRLAVNILLNILPSGS
eukprot:scaffold103852_cov69-Phaeocystis_antarctica.AAC.5